MCDEMMDEVLMMGEVLVGAVLVVVVLMGYYIPPKASKAAYAT